MRKIFTLVFIATTYLGLHAQVTPDVLYYKFDGTGTTIPNLATNPPSGTATANILGGVSQGQSGLCGGALIGNGASSSTDYVNTGWAPNLTGSWSICFRTSNIGASSTLFYIFGDAGTNSWRCFTNGVAGPNNWILRGPHTDITVANAAIVAPTMTTFVYDQSTGTLYGYLNDALVSTVSQPTTPTTVGTGPFKVSGYGSNVGLPANGYMDEFRVYSRALTAAEIAEIYNPFAAGGFASNDTAFCGSGSVDLSVNLPAQNVLWSNGDTTDVITVSSSGAYTVAVSGVCGSGMDTVAVVQSNPLSTGFLGSDLTLCSGDTANLSTGSSDPALWSTGATTSSITVNSAGTYSVEVSNICGNFMDTVVVTASNTSYTNFLNASTASGCEGDQITIGTSSLFDTYSWSNGATTSMTTVTTSGSYVLTVGDACGMGVDTVVVTVTDSAEASFTSSVSGATANFTNTSTGGGSLTYLWDFGNGVTSTFANPSHTYATSGTYTVTLTVTNSCGTSTTTSNITITIVGMEEGLNFNVNVYPNPANGLVNIAAELPGNQDIKVSLLSSLGQVIRTDALGTQSGSFSHKLDVSELAAGLYFVRLEANDRKAMIRLVVE